MITTALPTRNEDWGFFGTMASLDANTAQAWDVALLAVATATGASPEGVRDFLDSQHGRRLADEVANGLHIGLELEAAIRLAVQRWNGGRINRATSRETGTPLGLPYLTGLAVHFEILAEADADA